MNGSVYILRNKRQFTWARAHLWEQDENMMHDFYHVLR